MKNSSRKGFSISILILTILFSIYLFLHSSFFNINKISITGLNNVSATEIKALAGIKTGTNIFEINSEICSRSIQIHPMVKKALIIRHLPRRIEIKVTERKMWAVVPYNEDFLCIDDEGTCLDKVNNINISAYPIITLSKAPEHVMLGQAVAPVSTKMIRQVWNALTPSNQKQISEFHYLNQKEGLVIYTVKGTEIKFGNLDRLKEKTRFFDQIFEMEKDFPGQYKEVLQYVDLRYKGQPVIKTRK
ncbi:MAG: FtsQ-type POTRA domain-containing protein [Syntrophomonas sp.]